MGSAEEGNPKNADLPCVYETDTSVTACFSSLTSSLFCSDPPTLEHQGDRALLNSGEMSEDGMKWSRVAATF